MIDNEIINLSDDTEENTELETEPEIDEFEDEELEIVDYSII